MQRKELSLSSDDEDVVLDFRALGSKEYKSNPNQKQNHSKQKSYLKDSPEIIQRQNAFVRWLQTSVLALIAIFVFQIMTLQIEHGLEGMQYFKNLCYIGLLLPSIWVAN